MAALGLALALLATAVAAQEDPFSDQREQMVEAQLRQRGIAESNVLQAFGQVPRHRFVPEALRGESYSDRPVSIGNGQTVHQPYLVALMTSLLELDRGAKVLEIGTGSGYHSAILSKLSRQVFTIEINAESAKKAKATLDELGCRNVHVRIGDGYQGWPSEAPFDAIILTTAPPRIPQPLIEQLRIGGKMVVPVGTRIQDLVVLTRTEDGYERRVTVPVSLPPMSGEVEEGG